MQNKVVYGIYRTDKLNCQNHRLMMCVYRVLKYLQLFGFAKRILRHQQIDGLRSVCVDAQSDQRTLVLHIQSTRPVEPKIHIEDWSVEADRQIHLNSYRTLEVSRLKVSFNLTQTKYIVRYLFKLSFIRTVTL